jgi:Family of unknown function (DUF6131)
MAKPLAAAGPLGLLRHVRSSMILLGIILLILGFVLTVHILWILGIVLLVIGLILAVLGATGRAVGGRPHYF